MKTSLNLPLPSKAAQETVKEETSSSLAYKARVYLQLKQNQEIFYANIVTELCIEIVNENSFCVTFKDINITEQSPLQNIIVGNFITEMSKLEGESLLFDKSNLTPVQYSNPLLISLLRVFSDNTINYQSAIFPNLPITLNEKKNVTSMRSTKKKEQISYENHRIDVKDSKLGIAKFGSEDSRFKINVTAKIKEKITSPFPDIIYHSIEEQVGGNLNLFISSGIERVSENKVNYLTRFYSLLRIGASACW